MGAAELQLTPPGICPTCGQRLPLPYAPKRVCCVCHKPIRKDHKWFFGPDSRPQHRNCADPVDYKPERKA